MSNSDAIQRGVSNWLDVNKDEVFNQIRQAVLDNSEVAIEYMAVATMRALKDFLAEHGKEILSSAIERETGGVTE